MESQQGNLLEQQDIEAVKPGMTRSQVRFLLGTPVVQDPFHQDRWDYIYFFRQGRSRTADRRWLIVYFEEDRVREIQPDVPVEELFKDLPVMGVSLLAALEYCHWLSDSKGGRWRFRLPRSSEWEKAARGVDGRPFVWGEHLYWTFCTLRLALRVELFPLDESVYGIRDLAGSLSEHIGERAFEDNMFLVRGGNFNVTDERDFRAASRDQSLPYQQWEHIGFRVVADLPAREE